MLDWIFIVVLLGSLLLGLWRGLVYEVISVVSWVAAFVLAQWLAPEVAQKLPMAGATEVIRFAAAFVLVFVVVVMAFGLLAWLGKKLMASVGLSPLDRLLGAVFGLVRGAVVLLALTVVVQMTPLKRSAWWQDSVGAGAAQAVLKSVKPLLPEKFGQYLG